MLNIHNEYDCIRFAYSPGCCKSPRVSILLDNMDTTKLIDKIDEINIIYDEELINNINEIQLIYKNNGFFIKALPKNNNSPCSHNNSNCSLCSKKCGNCHKNNS